MSKHGKRAENIQSSRGRTPDTGVTSRPNEPGATGLSGDAPVAEGSTADREALGKYWIVIILWSAGFGVMIAFELIAALFSR
jgi:hypothetical protein